ASTEAPAPCHSATRCLPVLSTLCGLFARRVRRGARLKWETSRRAACHLETNADDYQPPCCQRHMGQPPRFVKISTFYAASICRPVAATDDDPRLVPCPYPSATPSPSSGSRVVDGVMAVLRRRGRAPRNRCARGAVYVGAPHRYCSRRWSPRRRDAHD